MSSIGNLPTEIIHKVLELMPIQDAARLSILSKEWREIWSSQPNLVFDPQFFDYVSKKGDSTAIRIIHKILMQHTGPILGFYLQLDDRKQAHYYMDQCFILLSKDCIQKLTIMLINYSVKYSFPCNSIFTCSALTHLKLSGCIIKLLDAIKLPNLVSLNLQYVHLEGLPPPASFKGFDRLTSLELHHIIIDSNLLASLISHCPLLEQLVLHDISSYIIEINAPMLRSFDFEGAIGFISFQNVQLLAKLSLRLIWYDYVRAQGKCDFAKFFESFPALEHLHLSNFTIKFLVAGTRKVPTRLPFDLNCVKRLYLSGIFLHKLDHVLSCALCLIRSSPNLQYLEIKGINSHDDAPALESLEMERFSDVTFIHLKKVKLQGSFLGKKPQMQLIKLLLAKSPALVKIQLIIKPRVVPSQQYPCITRKLMAEISMFQRASPKAQVVYSI